MAPVGLPLASSRVFVRDIERVWAILLPIGFFLVPVFYSVAILETDLRRQVFPLNPLARLMVFSREILTEGRVPSLLRMGYEAHHQRAALHNPPEARRFACRIRRAPCRFRQGARPFSRGGTRGVARRLRPRWRRSDGCIRGS